MDHSAELRRCLIEMDVAGVTRLWRHLAPHLPQPETPEQALFALHTARVEMTTLPAPLKAYSRAWLAEYRPSVIVRAVGISVSALDASDPASVARATAIQDAMAGAVADAVKAGVPLTDTAEISRRMRLARG